MLETPRALVFFPFPCISMQINFSGRKRCYRLTDRVDHQNNNNNSVMYGNLVG